MALCAHHWCLEGRDILRVNNKKYVTDAELVW